MKKILPFLFILTVFMLYGCSAEEPDDLYGFTVSYNNICDTKISVSDFIEYENEGVTAYSCFFSAENGTLMLTLREDKESRYISSCSVTGENDSEKLSSLFMNVCRAFTTLTDSECSSAIAKCVNGDFEYGSYAFSFDENEYAACYNIDSLRFTSR